MSNAQSVLEFTAGAGNPTGNGPTIGNQVITLQKNTNNPSGNTFATFTPTTTATFSLTNQVQTMTVSPNVGVIFGATSNSASTTLNSFALFPLINAAGGPSNANFTSANSTAGTGIDITANRNICVYVSTRPLLETGATLPSTASVKYQFADLVITFNNPVTNPIIHFSGCGGGIPGAGGSQILLSTEFQLMNAGLSLTRLSGSSEFTLPTSTTIINGASQYSAATGSGGMSGSVQVNGQNLTSVTFRIFLSAQDNISRAGIPDNWNGGSTLINTHNGDLFTIGISESACNAGTSAPLLSTSTVNICAPNTVNLNSYHTSTTPTGSSLVWFTNNTHSGAAYTTPTAATAGTYYAFYYDSTNTCYSPASNSLTVTVNSLPTVTAPASTPVSYCQNATATALSVTGTAGSGTISSYSWYRNTTASNSGGTLVTTNSTSATTNSYTPDTTTAGTYYYYVSITNSNGCTFTGAVSGAISITTCSCYKPAQTTGTTLDTNHGITALGRAGADNSNWPMVRKGAWTALEAKTKGFVVNRMASSNANVGTAPSYTTYLDEPVNSSGVAVITNPVVGMMFYDTRTDCLKINIDGTRAGWKCFNTQACPD